MCGFDGVWRGSYFKRELIMKTEVEVRVGKLKNGKTASKDEVKLWWTGFGDCVIWPLIWILCLKPGGLF